MNSFALRIQRLGEVDGLLALSHVAQLRSETGRCAPGDVEELFHELAIPAPTRISNVLTSLERTGLMTRSRGRGRVWSLTPEGRQRLLDIGLDVDVNALLAEARVAGSSTLAGTVHPTLPPTLAPPEVTRSVQRFLERFPFDRNVFGMTRFPDDPADPTDPVVLALERARTACEEHGLQLHLASDRAITDGLWSNVNAHIWASKYGIAFFEDRGGRGMNYNMTIEVGSMLMAGRRCAILKDRSIAALPTDLVGHIYKPVDLEDEHAVDAALHSWLRDDLGFQACRGCAPARRAG